MKLLAGMFMVAAACAQPELAAIRNSILDVALKATRQQPGLFSMTVPTGGGKTLAALAFALARAAGVISCRAAGGRAALLVGLAAWLVSRGRAGLAAVGGATRLGLALLAVL